MAVEIVEKSEGRDEPFTEIPLERLENGLPTNGDNMDTGLSIETSKNYNMERKRFIRLASLKKDLVNLPFEQIGWLDSLSRNHPRIIVTIAGFASNLVTKGTMKAVGFIFKAIMGHVKGLSPALAVIFPSLMHLFFNCFSPIISLVVRHLDYFWTLILGNTTIATALYLMSWISRDNVGLATLILCISGPLLGIGCALGYHTGVLILNRIVKDKRNATYNGFSLAGNTVGAIIVFHFISQLFGKLPYENSLEILTACTFGFSMVFALIYLIPQRHINMCPKEEEVENNGEKWYESLYDKTMFKNPSYYLLIISQCSNAIGFLNLTTFINIHLAQRLKYDNWNIVMSLSVIQVCDLIGRMLFPFLADQLKKYCWFSIHLFYMIGTLGTGACMISLKHISTDYELYTTFVLIGLFSSCFIATWNSLIKSETTDHKGFTIIYSHSLFVCGFVQLIVTVVMLQLVSEKKENNYGHLMEMFGATLMTAALPVFILLFVGLRKKEETEATQTAAITLTVETPLTTETTLTAETVLTTETPLTDETSLKPPREPLVMG